MDTRVLHHTEEAAAKKQKTKVATKEEVAALSAWSYYRNMPLLSTLAKNGPHHVDRNDPGGHDH